MSVTGFHLSLHALKFYFFFFLAVPFILVFLFTQQPAVCTEEVFCCCCQGAQRAKGLGSCRGRKVNQQLAGFPPRSFDLKVASGRSQRVLALEEAQEGWSEGWRIWLRTWGKIWPPPSHGQVLTAVPDCKRQKPYEEPRECFNGVIPGISLSLFQREINEVTGAL